MTASIHTAAVPARHPSARIGRITLDDGREVVVRPVRPVDAPAAQAFVRALSSESRHQRFHARLKELPASLLRQMTEVDHVTHVAIIAEALGDEDDTPTIVADARYARQGDETHLAIAVADDWQGQGLGRALMQRLLGHAARQGIAHVVADMLVGNTAVARLAAAFGGRLGASPQGPGVRRARIELAAATRAHATKSSRAALPGAGPMGPLTRAAGGDDRITDFLLRQVEPARRHAASSLPQPEAV